MLTTKKNLHQTLAQYFAAKPLYLDEEKKKPNIRKLVELPWQQTEGQMWTELEDTLTSLEYIEAKCTAELRYELVIDYNRAEKSWPWNEEPQREEERIERIRKYTGELIAYDKDPDHQVLPEFPPVIFPQHDLNVQQKTNDWSPLESIQAWGHFVVNNISRILVQEPLYQLTYNYADSGPIIHKLNGMMEIGFKQSTPWIKLLNCPVYNPRPACIRTLYGHSDRVALVAITPDGLRAASVGDSLRFWNLLTGECEEIHGVGCISMTDDWRLAVSGGNSLSGDELNVKVWNLETHHCIGTYEGHTDHVTTASITSDGRFAVTGSCGYRGCDKTIRLWDISKNKCIYISDNHPSRVRRVRISPDGNYAISNIERSSGIYIWNLRTRKLQYEMSAGRGDILGIAVTIDSRKIVVASRSTIQVRNLEDGKLISAFENTHEIPSDLAITPNGNYAVTSGWDRKLCVWDLKDGKCIKSFEETGVGQILSVAITPDCRFAVTGEISGTVRVWDLHAQSSSIPNKHICDVQDICIIPDKSIVFTGAAYPGNEYASADPNVRVWDLNTQKCTRFINHNESGWRGLFLNPNGKQFITGHNKSLNLWNLNGELINKLETDTSSIGGAWRYKLRVTPDGSRVIFGHWNRKQGTLIIWDLRSNKTYEILEGCHGGSILDIKISSDGRNAITSSFDKTLRLWDLESLKCIGEMRQHTGQVDSVSIAPDNRSCISIGGDDGMAILWDLRMMRIIKRLYAYHTTDQADFLLDGRSTIIRGRSMGYGTCLCNIRQEKLIPVNVFNESVHNNISYDNKYIFAWNSNGIKIHNIEKNLDVVQIASTGDGFTSCGVAWPKLLLGRVSGNVSFFSLENLPLGPAIVTPVRLWKFAPLGQHGHWDKNVTTLCPWCDRRFQTQTNVLNTIDRINRSANLTSEQSPCLHLPDEAWEEPKLLSECPSCKKPLKYNPFKVDNSEGLMKKLFGFR